MRSPQVSERAKDAPASALRAMFASIGSLLSVTDKVRGKSAALKATATTAEPIAAATPEVTPAPESTAAETPAAETVTVTEEAVVEPEAVVAPEAVVEPEAVVVEAVVIETVVTEAVAPETTAAETTETPEAPEASAPGAALPLANYDELTLPSLRARLRTLSAAQVAELLAYEKSHADRGDVVTMFERRIAKLEAEA
jgi:hypothetical protein